MRPRYHSQSAVTRLMGTDCDVTRCRIRLHGLSTAMSTKDETDKCHILRVIGILNLGRSCLSCREHCIRRQLCRSDSVMWRCMSVHSIDAAALAVRNKYMVYLPSCEGATTAICKLGDSTTMMKVKSDCLTYQGRRCVPMLNGVHSTS